MATTKKPTSDSKDNEPAEQAVRKTAPLPASAVVMDIIPKNKVRPTTTSRPVITNSGPGVADNTMTQPSSAPLLQTKKRLTITPMGDRDSSDNSEAEATTASADQGASVEELIAKHHQKNDELTEAPSPKPDPSPVVIEVPTADPVAVSQLAPSRPAPSGLPEEVAADRAAAEAAASLLSGEPIEKSFEPASEQSTSREAPTSSAVADILKEEDDQPQPQEHSQALKDELKEMGVNGGPKTHHELYGGKPVIIVHKDHSMSAVGWTLWFLFCVTLALVAVNFLLDADVITTDYQIPHSNIL